ncbi:MAG: DNA primase [Acidimicrobiia bacterium]|nr:DNA primase [Acidimicrobiia bacterium]
MADRGDIDRVREATDLVDLISEVTKVKKSGRSFMAICPFHQEKTPSMSVDRARGLYHCFGCGKGGDVFTFVQETQGLDFGESVESLAKRAGITLTVGTDDGERRGRRASAVEAIRRAIDLYHTRLKKSPEAGPARAYLRARGYDLGIIEEWRLGFAGTDWDTLSKSLKTAGFGDRAMLDGGLARRGRQGLYDVFRGRLMFPIHDVRGDPVGFGGRKVEGIEAKATSNPDAKYVNSADSVVYHKANVLFGLDRSRKSISSDGEAVVVEGYTDVIAMHQAGIATAVATCGTALGDGHFDLLRRFTDRVVLAFDSDEAGTRAALRGDELESPFRLDIDLRVAVMPDGLDPADLVQADRSGDLIAAVREARPLLEHRIAHEVSRFDLDGPEGRARAVHAAASHVRRVRDPIARREYSRYVARLTGVELPTVEEAVGRARTGTGGESPADDVKPLDRVESELLRVVLANQPGAGDVSADDFTDKRLAGAYEAVADIVSETPQGTPVDVSRVSDPDAQSVLRSLSFDTTPLPNWTDVWTRARGRKIDLEIDKMEEQLADLDEGSELHSEVLRGLIALQQEKRSLGGT